MEHRWGERVTLGALVWLDGGARGGAEGHVVNVSRSGALIRTQLKLFRLSRVDFELNGRQMSSYVTRIAGDEVGVEWCGPPPEMPALRRLQRPSYPPSHPPCRLHRKIS